MDVEQLLLEGRLTVRIWEENDPILTAVCARIEDNEFGPKLEEFGRLLLAKMQQANGLGLAAPQVGLSKRIFAMVLPGAQRDKGLQAESSLVVCNPQLVLGGSSVFAQEGCLSLPKVFEQVGRASEAYMRFYHPDGREDEMELTGLNARIGQHEADHLMGIMFLDRLPRQMKRAVLQRWAKMKQKRV